MDFFNWIGEQITTLIETVISVLPKSPIVWLESNPVVAKYMPYVNWFIPVYTFIGMAEVWVTACVAYYSIKLILRWAKFE